MPACRLKTLARTAIATAMLVGATAGITAGTAVAAGDDVSWTVRTASNHFGDARTSYSYAVNPGGKIEDALVVANHGKAPLTLGVYAADGFTTGSGQFDLITKDRTSVGVGTWVKADQASVTVKPGKSAELPFTVSVPANATPGDHAGGIITSLVQADDADGINVDRRLAILIKLRVGGDLKPTLAVEDLQVNYRGTMNPFGKGDADVSYTIRNTGNALLSAKQSATASGPFGWLRTSVNESDPGQKLLPGESRKVSVRLRGVAPAVRLAGTATITPLITDAAGSTTALDPVTAKTHGWAVSWILWLLIVVLIVVVVGGIPFVRRRRAQRALREDARVQAAVEERLREQAEAR
jgi:hypothetical protein